MTTEKLTTRQLRNLATRKKLYESALRLMEDMAIDDITISHICTNAGVSVGSFYRHFKTKTDIFVEMYEQADTYFLDKYRSQHLTATTRERILEFFDTYSQYQLKIGLQTVKQLYTCNNKLFIMRGRNMQKMLQRIIENGQESGDIDNTDSAENITQYLFISARGLIYNWCLHDGGFDLREGMRNYMNRLLVSIQCPHPGNR
ncbi:TetR/AcrR family transcriptional regulator [Dickeya undicola]|uniref:TetR/AcrR family transcriptional regulator n=1 Tax=Dickeya undicola TaxID=1577887 RepID=A0A3N0FY26_9GAMM|nr:TetR/AcrR family transcriptional regulator [Dickeya undicola]RNM05029.1 TetR/AcrR family transcriptional regulator [Dickeya undicola]RNM19076.1 TetR/AcrR family transcriptional regulator [Dickeya undicola]